jgi:hypothetical protein
MRTLQPGEPTRCTECGVEVRCGAALGEETCWCDDLPPVKPRLEGLAAGAQPTCLCEACLRKRADEEAS